MDETQNQNDSVEPEVATTSNEIVIDAAENTTPEKKKLNLFGFLKDPKKRLIAIIILGLLLIGLVSAGFYFLRHETPVKDIVSSLTNKEADKTVVAETFQAPLDGVMTDKDSSLRHPVAVVVENHVDARPQAGLNKASVVYEAISEGGITRFLALFSTHEAVKVGPVRSVRTYFVDWAHGYNAFIAHVGGNMDALDKIKAEKSYDLDQFANSAPYWREYKAGLATEHTMYTSTEKLRTLASSKGYPTANNFSVYKFKDDPDQSALPTAQTVSVNYGNASYNVVFTYDKTTNSYLRSQGGKTHVDQVDKTQLNPKDVIVMTVARKAVTTRINEAGYEMTTTGSGKAKIFIDGTVIDGTWRKESAAARELFYDAAGNEVIFNRGQLWISVVPPEAGLGATVS